MISNPTFRRTIAVDDHYLFTIKDEVQNKGGNPVTLFPYALISRHGAPKVLGYYILHEGLIGVMGDQGEQTETYKKMDDKKSESWEATDAWLGFTDKYFAATLLPDTDAKVKARFFAQVTARQTPRPTLFKLWVPIAATAGVAVAVALFVFAFPRAPLGVESNHHPAVDHGRRQGGKLLFGAVAPMHPFGSEQPGEFFDPGEEARVLGCWFGHHCRLILSVKPRSCGF